MKNHIQPEEPYNDVDCQYRVLYKFDNDVKGAIKGFWKNKLFMPESCARYFIKITAVRAERLQDISDADCLKEGIMVSFGSPTYFNGVGICGYSKPADAYKALINKINGKDTWENNPYVWVYDFELIVK